MNLIQDYQLVNLIYTNAQCQIIRVVFSGEKTPVLIKKINSKSPKIEVTRTLAHEYRLFKKFTNQTIIKAHRLENHKREYVLVLEDFAGENLRQFWQSRPRKFADFLTIGVQLAIALEAMHNQGIIHQNIQPDCILIDPRSLELKIVDFSLATAKSVAVTKLLPGLNLAYIAPEQTGRMNIPLDYRTDFYSTGIIFYQMLTGSVPYQTQKSLELIHCHLAQIPPAPNYLDEDIPEILSSIVMKLLAKNPGDRYQSASALKADLQRCQGQYNEQQSIELFELGTLDHRSQFKLATKLYGRATALEAIAESLARIGSETGEMLLLMGDSGIGKTVLVNQVISSIIGTRGYFITGKFESFTKDIPYKAITEALRELIQHLLTETPENRQFWQQKIQQTIGSNGKVITNILPELELIIGSQPELPTLQLKEQENLFNTVFVKFLKIFAQPKLPLILFLDNLQWADSSSLSLIELLLNECKGHDLLIVAACRNQNLSPSDPLWQAIENMAQTVRLNQINLSPLTINEINSLLIDSLECDSEQSFPLAQLLWQRSHGNPFFVHLLLQSFNQTELLKFDFATLSWQWSIEELRNTSIANYNILELVCRNLNQLPLACLQILKLAACIGNCFNLDLLTDICQQATEQPIEFQIDLLTFPNQHAIAQELDYALQGGIIVPQESQGTVDYQFVHDHVHQTVYSFLEPEEIVKLHSLIGNFYLEQMSPPKIAEKIFEIVRHLNLGRTSLKEQSEIDRLIELNLAAGQKAKAANAHQLAVYYLDIALDLLPSSYWQDNYSLILAVFLQASEVHYLQGNFIYAEQLINLVLTQAETILERVPVYKTKVHTSIAQNEMQLAIDIGLYMLKLLKINLPNSFTEVQEDTLCLEVNIKSLKNLPIMSDQSQIRAMEILTTIIPPVYIVKPALFPVLVAKMIELCLQHGNCPLSAYAYALYGLLLCTSGNIETGYHLGKLALELQEQFDAREIKSKVSFLFNNMIRHWREPAILTLDHFLAGIESGLEVGDIEHACFHATRYCAHLFYVGESLSTACQKSEKQIKFISDFLQSFQLNYAQMWHQFNLNLQGKAEDKFLLIGDIFDETKFFDLWLESNNAMSLFSFYLIKLILAYLWGDYQQAVIYGSQGKQYLQAAVGLMGYGVYHFYYALAMLAVCSQADQRAEYLPEVLALQTRICHWSNHTADYLHKRELIAAEIAKISGEHESAAEHYDQAIIAASAAGYTHELALTEELAGEFYLSKGKTKIAYYYLNDAYKSYQRWGAWAKVRQLELKQPHLLNSVVEPDLTENSDLFEIIELDSDKSGSNLANFDLFSIIKASQAI
ncbi:MAG: serine/threonine-protein kinase PknK, partial [Cyanobacteria bacterium P01_C01_bin.72]